MEEVRPVSRPMTTRREFTKKLALVAAAPLAAAEATAGPPVDGPPRPAEAATVGQALAEVVRLRFGKHLLHPVAARCDR